MFGIGLLVLVGAVIFGYWFFFMRGIVFSDDARISGHLVDLAPEINGKLIDVLVHEGQPVRNGDNLFRLDEETASLLKAVDLLSVAHALKERKF